MLVLNFVKNFLAQADIDNGNVRVGVVLYSTSVHVEFLLHDYTSKTEVLTAIDNIPYRYGSTNTADGIKSLRTEIFTQRSGDRQDVPNIAIILTDGVSNINARRTVPEAQDAQLEGIELFAIGIGLADTRELNGMASPPLEEHRFIVEDFSQLNNLQQRVFSSFCTGLLVCCVCILNGILYLFCVRFCENCGP